MKNITAQIAMLFCCVSLILISSHNVSWALVQSGALALSIIAVILAIIAPRSVLKFFSLIISIFWTVVIIVSWNN